MDEAARWKTADKVVNYNEGKGKCTDGVKSQLKQWIVLIIVDAAFANDSTDRTVIPADQKADQVFRFHQLSYQRKLLEHNEMKACIFAAAKLSRYASKRDAARSKFFQDRREILKQFLGLEGPDTPPEKTQWYAGALKHFESLSLEDMQKSSQAYVAGKQRLQHGSNPDVAEGAFLLVGHFKTLFFGKLDELVREHGAAPLSDARMKILETFWNHEGSFGGIFQEYQFRMSWFVINLINGDRVGDVPQPVRQGGQRPELRPIAAV